MPIEDRASTRSPLTWRQANELLQTTNTSVQFRGVPLDDLERVLTTGIDVMPTTAVIYVSDIDKAWEYPPSLPKAILAIDGSQLDPTYRTLRRPVDLETLAATAEAFPTVVEHDEYIWCSKLTAADPQLETSYETQFARWIPGNPMDAILGVFAFLPPTELDRHSQMLATALSNAAPDAEHTISSP